MRSYTAACVCDAGARRDGNEDNFLFGGELLPEKNGGLAEPKRLTMPARSGLLLAVFDGLGGASFGEKAAFLAACVLRDTALGARMPSALVQALQAADREIRRQAEALRVSEMGATAAAAYLRGGALDVANLGDSRIYLHRGGALICLSKDHTDAALLRKLKLTNRRPSLTQYLGMSEEIRLQPYTAHICLRRGDRLLLCSDGLNERLGDTAIRGILESDPAPETAVRRLCAVARACGAGDNITAILLRAD